MNTHQLRQRDPHTDHDDKFVPLVNRIRMLKAYNLSDENIAIKLVAEGQTPADVWLCIMAAVILDE